MCDRVAILARGRCVAQGSVDEVLSGGARAVFLRVDDRDKAQSVLQTGGITVEPHDDGLRASIDPADAANITRILADANLYVKELRPDQADLETVFLELTRDRDEEVETL